MRDTGRPKAEAQEQGQGQEEDEFVDALGNLMAPPGCCKFCFRPAADADDSSCAGCLSSGATESRRPRIKGDRYEMEAERFLLGRMEKAAKAAYAMGCPLATWQMKERFGLTRGGVERRMLSIGWRFDRDIDAWLPGQGKKGGGK